ncbi:acyl-CoA dehydrogenase family protein [Nocardia bovistercoris]|uniref:Acyl-CoA dehydrogenase n=1 Tax=Nocardia bovistercoris TaxID=2785916 RepID=A0A931IGG3_9NOCA|nr:acyl-CoA dehydrogenase [Nocardia bovistercoris]
MTIASTPEQRELGTYVEQFAARYAPLSGARDTFAGLAAGELPAWWKELTANGFHAVHLPEHYGGQGGDLLDAACVLEAAGKAGLPGPLLPTMTAGAIALLAEATPSVRVFLEQLAGGATATVLLPRSSGPRARPERTGWSITGASPVVAGARSARFALVGAVRDTGETLWVAVDTARPECVVEPVDGTDLLTDLATITLTDYPVDTADVWHGIDADRAEYLAVAATAAMAAGIARWCVEAATAHLRVREQFGKPIGAFQALQHRAALLFVDSELATAAAWDAVRAAGDTLEQHRIAAAGAALTTIIPGPDLVLDTMTMFGAIGFTWEHDLHLYWRRATSLAASIGAPGRWARRLGESTIATERDFTVDIGDADAEFRAGVAATLDAARALTDDGPGRQGDYPHFATGARRDTIAAAGLVAPQFPAPWGIDASPLRQLVIDEEFRRRPDLVRPSLGIAEWILPSLRRAATEEPKQLITPTLRGELAWCQLFSELGAGSDLAALVTRAERVEGGWRINGHKIWTSAAHRADYGALLARTDPQAAKHRGIGYFVVDMRSPGIEINPIRQVDGDAHFNEVFLTDVFVPDHMLIGEPTAGWDLAIATMAEERTAISGYVVLDRAAAVRTVAATASGEDRDDAVRALGELDAYANAIKALGVREILRLLDGHGAGAASSVSKVAMNILLRRTFRATLATTGRLAMAAATEPAVTGPYLTMPAELIGGGTKEIQLNIIAQMILGLPRK